ncbi:MAG: hypothetical protein OXQ31_10895 [Spirochaetaceae bacterium]|nr:hypothetical protein [Spirochaetaceae bacterium]
MSNELRAYGDELVRLAQGDPEMIRGHAMAILTAIAMADLESRGTIHLILSSLRRLEEADIVYRDPKHAESSRRLRRLLIAALPIAREMVDDHATGDRR